jgi:hypothetical protein
MNIYVHFYKYIAKFFMHILLLEIFREYAILITWAELQNSYSHNTSNEVAMTSKLLYPLGT